MRTVATAIAACLIVFGVVTTPTARAATVNSKVVIIVGATEGTTDSYRSDADQVYAEAIKYTSNVVRVYSPHATWSKVKSAVAGASVVVYLGHGNGWPSPYTYDPKYTTKDGFGLNHDNNGDGKLSDYEKKYYGEPYIETLDLAPNAVVLLFHLCYASGNSEPGNPEPTLSVAKQRADNYASAFLRAGARAVIADAHSHSPYYMSALFTTHLTMDQLWRNAPDFHNHAYKFASVRSSGYTIEQDPTNTSSGYYRSLGGKLDLTTDLVTGASYASTDVDPPTFVISGAASVNVDTAGLYADSKLTPAGDGSPGATLARDTRLRLLAKGGTTSDGHPILQVATLDGTTGGWMSGADLVPRDSVGPSIWTVDDGDGAFSPNGDGHLDSYSLTSRISESSDWRIRFLNGAGTVLASKSGAGDTVSVTWDGIVGGTRVPDGSYRYAITAADDWGNPVGTRSGTFIVDTDAPAFDDADAPPAATPTFTPNGDGSSDAVAFTYSVDEPGYVNVKVRNGSGTVVRSFAVGARVDLGSLMWDGRTDAGGYVPNGTYSVRLTPRDLAGNLGPSRDRSVNVYRTLGFMTVTKTLFFPQDLDKYARSTTFGFKLSGAARVTLVVRNASGAVVYTKWNGASLAAGTYTFTWNGRRADGTMAPRGAYRAYVTATDGIYAATLSKAVLANAFRITSSDTTPGRGQTITLTAVSAEALGSLPRVTVKEPGLTAWTVTMTKASPRHYQVTLRLKTGGSSGLVTLSVRGVDLGGGRNRTTLTLPLH